MNTVTANLDRFNRELTQLQQALTGWQEELTVRETQTTKDAETVRRQREELILKSNIILEQVNGLRGQKEAADQKMLEAEKLKKSAVAQLEQAETMMSEIRSKENEIELREKNIKLLEEREKRVKDKEETLRAEQDQLAAERDFLKKEQELSNEKQQALVIRENRVALSEARQKRVMSDL